MRYNPREFTGRENKTGWAATTTVLTLLDALDAARAETERLRVELELAREVVEAFRSMVYRYQWAHQFQGVDVVSYRARDAERVKKALCRYDSRRGGKS